MRRIINEEEEQRKEEKKNTRTQFLSTTFTINKGHHHIRGEKRNYCTKTKSRNSVSLIALARLFVL